MIELSEQNVTEYLRAAGRASDQPLLVQSLSGGVANVVLKVFDPGAGEKIGSDTRSPAQIRRGVADTRMHQGACFVLKQPLPKFKTQAEWLVDIDRVHIEKDCLELLASLLPAGSVPEVLWFDEANYILAIACAPTDSLIWKKDLLAGRANRDAATHAGMLLAMLHSGTLKEPGIAERYGDPKLFVQQRIDPYFQTVAAAHPEVGPQIQRVAKQLLDAHRCLIHGDFSPKNMFLVPRPGENVSPPPAGGAARKPSQFPLSHLMLLDFEVAYHGHPAFDVATLVNHLLLKGFYFKANWRPFMLAADAFWQTYLHTADKELARLASAIGGHVLGSLLLARIDGKSPVEYITEASMKQQVREAAKAILREPDASLDHALDTVSASFDTPA